jgi:hypothetical protein
MIHYKLIREIGRGGMGVVYEARMVLPMGESLRVAIKRIKTLGLKELEMFSREAVTSLRISNNHPNLLTTHNFGMSNHGPFLVMEFVDGVSLCTLAKSGKLEHAHIRRIARDTLSALAHMHAHDVVHRDVSPGNILISREGVIKLADLGLVRAVDGSHSGQFRGTSAYASPEALQAVGFSACSDLYSLGVVLYELITRTLPYGSGEPTSVFGNMQAGPPAPLPEETPADLARLITGMMTIDSGERGFVSANGALAFLDAHGEPVADGAELGALVEDCIGTRPRSEDKEGTKQGKGNTLPVLEDIDPLEALFERQYPRVPWRVVAVAAVVLLAAGLGVLGGINAAERSGAGSASPGEPMVECMPAGPAPFPASDAARSEDAPAPGPGPVENAPASGPAEHAPAPGPVENAPAPGPVEHDPASGPVEVASADKDPAVQSRPGKPRKRERRASARPVEPGESARPGESAELGESARPLFYRVPRLDRAEWAMDHDKETHKP